MVPFLYFWRDGLISVGYVNEFNTRNRDKNKSYDITVKRPGKKCC